MHNALPEMNKTLTYFNSSHSRDAGSFFFFSTAHLGSPQSLKSEGVNIETRPTLFGGGVSHFREWMSVFLLFLGCNGAACVDVLMSW